MRKSGRLFLVVAVPCLVIASALLAQAADKENTTEGSDKGVKRVSAASVDYSAELELPFATLTTLGSRIESARQSADPVGLASAAMELKIAEQVSDGKKAAPSSSELIAEAANLAEIRGVSVELRAVAAAIDDKELTTKLKELADDAAIREEEAIAASKAGEKPKGIHGELIFNNESHEHVHVYYNGREIGHADPHEHKHFHVHDHAHRHYFDLKAVGHHHTWRRHVHGDFRNYTWTIH